MWEDCIVLKELCFDQLPNSVTEQMITLNIKRYKKNCKFKSDFCLYVQTGMIIVKAKTL